MTLRRRTLGALSVSFSFLCFGEATFAKSNSQERLQSANGLLKSDMTLRYQESDSFGTVRPDEPAKPAETDVYPRRDQPPTEDDGNSDGSYAPRNEPQSPSPPRPKYRDVYEQASRRDRSYGDDESVGVSIGVGFGFSYFSGSLGFTFPINRYVAWGLSGDYLTRSEDDESEVASGGELALILRVPNPTPLTPFVSAGPGYTSWTRSKDDGRGKAVFDDASSPTGNWAVGASIRLARYVSLVGALRSTTYTERPPRVFTDDHSKYELRTNERFDFGFAFTF